MQSYFKGQQERMRAYATVKRLSAMRGNDTNPVEDVIDLAQAIKYIMEDIFVADSLEEGF